MDIINKVINESICMISNIEVKLYSNNMMINYFVNNKIFITEIKKLNLISYNGEYFVTKNGEKYYTLLNIDKVTKIFPNNIGKLSRQQFCNEFDLDYIEEMHNVNELKQKNITTIKEYILAEPEKMITKYHKNLFKNNTICILLKKYNINDLKYKIYVFDNFHFDYKLEVSKIKYTKNIENWQISNTLKYDEITIGNFSIGKNIVFKVNLTNYIEILNNLDTTLDEQLNSLLNF